MDITPNNNNFHLLSAKENYFDDLLISEHDLLYDFNKVLIDYLKYAIKPVSTITLNNYQLFNFLIIRGVDTICHVFILLLYFTNNKQLVLFHCQKSFYFYIEFVSQITHDDKSFLKLNSNDAVLYVYKKTIYEIKQNKKTQSMETRNKFLFIENSIEIIKCLLYNFLQNESFKENSETILTKYSNIMSIIFYNNEKISTANLNQIYKIINIVANKLSDSEKFCDRVLLFLKTITNNKCVLENMYIDDIIEELIL